MNAKSSLDVAIIGSGLGGISAATAKGLSGESLKPKAHREKKKQVSFFEK